MFHGLNKKPDNKEKTFIMVKPDGVQRGLIGEIIRRFEQRGFQLVAMKFMQVSRYLGCLLGVLNSVLFIDKT